MKNELQLNTSDNMVREKIDHLQYKRKEALLTDNEIQRSVLYRWVVDLAVVKLVTSGKVALEELELCGIDFDKTLENAKQNDIHEL